MVCLLLTVQTPYRLVVLLSIGVSNTCLGVYYGAGSISNQTLLGEDLVEKGQDLDDYVNLVLYHMIKIVFVHFIQISFFF